MLNGLAMQQTDRYEALARELDAMPDFRVLRRLKPRDVFEDPGDRQLRLGAIVDVETSGLDPRQHEIIELAILPFTYSTDGAVIEAQEPFQSFRQPSQPIPAGITRLTGIDNAMVQGTAISVEAVSRFIEPVSLLVAHNARFDRPFLERFCHGFMHKAWACSQTQVPWHDEGFDGTKLSYLAIGQGLFFAGHRALDDCRAVLELLARPLPQSGKTGLATLLEAARRPAYRIWAIGAPFDTRELLKSFFYRWNDGSNGRPRAWHKDIDADDLQAELAFLNEGPFFDGLIDPLVQALDAYDRFSDRI